MDCTNNKVFSMRVTISTKTESNKAEFEEHKSDIMLKLRVSRKNEDIASTRPTHSV